MWYDYKEESISRPEGYPAAYGRSDCVDVQVNDVLTMKKPHPCGSKQWRVLRTGMDFKLKCLGCGHEVMLPRSKAEKNIRTIEREGTIVC